MFIFKLQTNIPAKDKTSSEVKSGERNLSFSNSLSQGRSGIKSGADRTNSPNARVLSTKQRVNQWFIKATSSNPGAETYG